MSNDKRFVYLYGYYASGKSVLARLLDGHPQLAVMPFHDRFMNGLMAMDDISVNDRLSERRFHVEAFKKIALAETAYHRLQAFHHGKPSKLADSSEGISGASLENFDFYQFEENWIDRVNRGGDFSPGTVFQVLLDEFFHQWEEYPYQEDCEYFVGWGDKRIENMEHLLNQHDGSKIIYLKRDPRGCVATRAARKETQEAYDYLRSGEIYDINRLHQRVENLREQHEQRVHIETFENLVTDSEETVERIRDFIGITKDDRLQSPTFCGEYLPQFEEKYIGEIVDDWDHLLTKKEKNLASLQTGQLSISELELDTIVDFARSYVKIIVTTWVKQITSQNYS